MTCFFVQMEKCSSCCGGLVELEWNRGLCFMENLSTSNSGVTFACRTCVIAMSKRTEMTLGPNLGKKAIESAWVPAYVFDSMQSGRQKGRVESGQRSD